MCVHLVFLCFYKAPSGLASLPLASQVSFMKFLFGTFKYSTFPLIIWADITWFLWVELLVLQWHEDKILNDRTRTVCFVCCDLTLLFQGKNKKWGGDRWSEERRTLLHTLIIHLFTQQIITKHLSYGNHWNTEVENIDIVSTPMNLEFG